MLKEASVFEWLDKNVADAKSIVDLGAGQFDKILHGPQDIPRIGIERHKKCVDLWGKGDGFSAVVGDMREFERLLPKSGFNDVALMLDVLEHIDHKSGEKLLRDLQRRFRKILVFTPMGKIVQEGDPWGVGNPYNAHVSGWNAAELEALGFSTVVDVNYHKPGQGAVFAVWERA